MTRLCMCLQKDASLLTMHVLPMRCSLFACIPVDQSVSSVYTCLTHNTCLLIYSLAHPQPEAIRNA